MAHSPFSGCLLIKTEFRSKNTHKKEHGGQRKALIENKVSVIQKVVAYEAGKNVRNEELGWLTNSKEEFIFKRLERLN